MRKSIAVAVTAAAGAGTVLAAPAASAKTVVEACQPYTVIEVDTVYQFWVNTFCYSQVKVNNTWSGAVAGHTHWEAYPAIIQDWKVHT